MKTYSEDARAECKFRSYKDVMKRAKRQVDEPLVIIVSTPQCPNEYREYLAAMNAGAEDGCDSVSP